MKTFLILTGLIRSWVVIKVTVILSLNKALIVHLNMNTVQKGHLRQVRAQIVCFLKISEKQLKMKVSTSSIYAYLKLSEKWEGNITLGMLLIALRICS